MLLYGHAREGAVAEGRRGRREGTRTGDGDKGGRDGIIPPPDCELRTEGEEGRGGGGGGGGGVAFPHLLVARFRPGLNECLRANYCIIRIPLHALFLPRSHARRAVRAPIFHLAWQRPWP